MEWKTNQTNFQLCHQPTQTMTLLKMLTFKDPFNFLILLTFTGQSTMWLSMASEVQKFFKVNTLLLLNFDPNLIIPVVTGEQLFIYWRKNILLPYLPKMRHFFGKKLNGVSDKLQILHTTKLPQKNLKIIFIPDPVLCEIGKYNILCNFFFVWNISIFRLVFNSPLTCIPIFPAACFNFNWFFCKSSICSRPYSTPTQIYFKSETGQRIISKYFVWNNVSSRKWEWRIRFCLISFMQLFKGDSNHSGPFMWISDNAWQWH